uniref:Uncharacterized protein n=1 Tax=Equus caballus TaxID=9796 RepID=F6RNI8_HORSE
MSSRSGRDDAGAGGARRPREPPEQELQRRREQKRRRHDAQQLQQLKHLESFYEKPPPGLIKMPVGSYTLGFVTSLCLRRKLVSCVCVPEKPWQAPCAPQPSLPSLCLVTPSSQSCPARVPPLTRLLLFLECLQLREQRALRRLEAHRVQPPWCRSPSSSTLATGSPSFCGTET